MEQNYHRNNVLSSESNGICLVIGMIESLPYVWKIKEYGDEESALIADEKCP